MFASMFGFGAAEEPKPEVTEGEEQKPEVGEMFAAVQEVYWQTPRNLYKFVVYGTQAYLRKSFTEDVAAAIGVVAHGHRSRTLCIPILYATVGRLTQPASPPLRRLRLHQLGQLQRRQSGSNMTNTQASAVVTRPFCAFPSPD